MSANRILTLALLFLLWSILPASAVAQAPPGGVIVSYPAAEPQEDSMALSVFFTVVDTEGRPISRPGIETVTIQLLGGSSPPIPASYADPQTPFFIALVLDASGSMANVMPKVREAAQQAIDNAPTSARVAVIKFNDLSIDDQLRPIQNFTNDLVLVKGAINAIEAEPNAPTCLYNAAYKTIELLDEATQNPQERQAIILFTDGKDERADGSPCSQWKYDDVINRATRALPITPIHTIGLCADALCSNIKKEELRSMAKETAAFSASGSQENLGQLFGEIMEGLNSQLVAKASVYPRQGINQAVLSVKLRDADAPLTTTFSFFSDRDYNAPPPPVTAQITSLIYDGETDTYTVALSVTSPENLQKVVVEVWDEKGGTQVPPRPGIRQPGGRHAVRAARQGAGRRAGIQLPGQSGG
ncbi:MAG: VWA domain-containing protein [Chloroflexi bacterium]|nr:MAG: VWA domain-containing protein [Chloroflexota bacterium]